MSFWYLYRGKWQYLMKPLPMNFRRIAALASIFLNAKNTCVQYLPKNNAMWLMLWYELVM